VGANVDVKVLRK